MKVPLTVKSPVTVTSAPKVSSTLVLATVESTHRATLPLEPPPAIPLETVTAVMSPLHVE